MAAEIQAAAVCQVCGLREQSEKDCWYHAIKGSEKGQRKGTRTKDDDDKRKGVCNKRDGGGDSASKCQKERESIIASYSGGGDPHCLTYTDDQFHWIATMEKVRPEVEQSNITGLLLDSRAACRVRPCRVSAGYSCDAFLTATCAHATFQSMLEAKSQRIDVHGEKITVPTRFRLIPVRRPIMSVCRPVGKEVVVIMKSECRYKSYKKDREIRLHKFNGVCQVHESESSGLYSLKRSNVDGSSAESVRETIRLWTRRLPYKPTVEERMSHSVIHLVFRAGCAHNVKGLARDWPHHFDSGLTPAIHTVARDFCVTNTKSDDVSTILVMKEISYQSASVTVMHDMSAIEFAVTTGARFLDFWEYREVIIT